MQKETGKFYINYQLYSVFRKTKRFTEYLDYLLKEDFVLFLVFISLLPTKEGEKLDHAMSHKSKSLFMINSKIFEKMIASGDLPNHKNLIVRYSNGLNAIFKDVVFD